MRRTSMRKRLLVGAAALSLTGGGLVLAGSPAYPTVSTDSGFEAADGDLADGDGAGGPKIDWNNFAPTTWSGADPYKTSTKTVSGWAFIGLADAQATTSDSAFAGGTKQDDACPTVNTGKAPNKDDLKRVYVTSNTVGGDVFLNLAWERIPQNTTSPSAHIGFEFNQSSTACGSASDGLVERTAGDMLIVYDFEGGATDTPTITLRRWVSSGSCEVGSNSPPCWGPSTDLTALGYAEGRVNTGGSVSDAIGPASPPAETLGTNEFGEAGINLTDAGVFRANVCTAFGKTYAVSRSSGNSATAQMKDLVGPGDINISNCGQVIIRKVTSPSPDSTDTTFSYTTTGGLSPATFGLKNGQARDYGSTVLAGSYSVTESDPSQDFQLTGLDCSASVTSHGTTITPSLGTRTVTFTLKPLDKVDCTYTNILQRGALRILKKSTKTGNPLVSTTGATFTVDAPAAATDIKVIDNGAADATTTPATLADEISDNAGTVNVVEGTGEICVSGLLPGSYSVSETAPPSGYADAPSTEDAQTVTVVANTNCGTSKPADTASGSFTNAPLADIQVNFKDGGSGETALVDPAADSITCVDADENATLPAGNNTLTEGWDNTLNVPGIPIDPSPRTIVCTIVIDP